MPRPEKRKQSTGNGVRAGEELQIEQLVHQMQLSCAVSGATNGGNRIALCVKVEWNLGAHNGGLGADDFGEDGVQRFTSAPVVVAVPRGPAEMLKMHRCDYRRRERNHSRGEKLRCEIARDYMRRDAGAAECCGDAGGVVGEGAVNGAKLRLQGLRRAGHLRVERQVGRDWRRARARPPKPAAARGRSGRGARPRPRRGGQAAGGGRHRLGGRRQQRQCWVGSDKLSASPVQVVARFHFSSPGPANAYRPRHHHVGLHASPSGSAQF